MRAFFLLLRRAWAFEQKIFLVQNKTRAETAQTMAYSESNILPRQFLNVKTIAYSQDSCRKSRQLLKVKTVREAL